MSGKQFDKYETVLLIDMTVKAEKGLIDKKDAWQQLSSTLREYGSRHKGIVPDEKYRNISGMRMRMSQIRFLLTGDKREFQSSSKLDREIFTMYIEDREQFDAILKEALIMSGQSPSNSNKDRFFKWMEENIPQTFKSSMEQGIIQAGEILGLEDKGGIFIIEDMDSLTELYSLIKKIPKFTEIQNFSSAFILMAIQSYIFFLKESGACAKTQSGKIPQAADNEGKYTPENPELIKNIQGLLESDFKKGFQLGSKRFIRQISNLYRERFGEDAVGAEDMEHAIKSCGYEYDGKIYPITAELKNITDRLLETAFDGFCQSACYDMLYEERRSELLNSLYISGPSHLENAIKAIAPQYHFGKGFISLSETKSPEDDIENAYRENTVMCLEDICKNLRFISEDRIKAIISSSDRFISAGMKSYALYDRVLISPKDAEETVKRAEEAICGKGFFLIPEIPYGESFDLNPDSTEKSIQEKIFKEHLSQKYSRTGKIIAPKGREASISAIVGDYIKPLEYATLSEIEEYEKDISGKSDVSLKTACRNMLRTDSESFVKKGTVIIDIDKTDSAIEESIRNGIAPLKKIELSFLPSLKEQAWNHFLLSGYIRHMSRKFSILGDEVKLKPAGGVFRKELGFRDMKELLAFALSKSDEELSTEHAAEFFVSEGYTVTKKIGDMAFIVSEAQLERDRRQM